jgi:hypothetical protein
MKSDSKTAMLGTAASNFLYPGLQFNGNSSTPPQRMAEAPIRFGNGVNLSSSIPGQLKVLRVEVDRLRLRLRLRLG